MGCYPTLLRSLFLCASVCVLIGFLGAACFGVAILGSVMYAKRLRHRGAWWALYVLGLHAALAPVYRRLKLSDGLGRRLSQLVAMIYQFLTIPTGAEIPLGAKLGRGLLLGHTTGIVLNAFAAVGDYCIITPGVVLGGDGRGGAPKIGRNVYIGANAVIAGPVVVGDSATVGACTVVTRDVPASALVVGNPGAIVKGNYKRSYHDYAKESGCE